MTDNLDSLLFSYSSGVIRIDELKQALLQREARLVALARIDEIMIVNRRLPILEAITEPPMV